MVATAVPPAATLDVAVYVLHLLRDGAQGDLAAAGSSRPLSRTQRPRLHRCHRALELDAAAHGYTAEEWLPVVCEARRRAPQVRPPERRATNHGAEAQDAISWLSRALIELDQDSAETANALSEALARLLAI